MSFKISNHRLVGVDYLASPNVGGAMVPVGILNHYTAGYNGQGAINTFLNKSSKVSAHLIIDRAGKVTQMVPFNRVAWHAGPSRYGSWNGLNNHFIGFEYDNIGYVKKTADGKFVDPYGKLFTPAPGQALIAEAEPRLGSGIFYWPAYTEIQLKVGLEITQALIDKYGIEAIATHEEVDTRGWKTDPGPAFPQQKFKALLDKRASVAVQTKYPSATVNASSLNVRAGAGPQWERFASLARGAKVVVKSEVNGWTFIEFENGREGWVSSQYLTR
jgi:N-acetylmuramoyl-L-alanine amidase